MLVQVNEDPKPAFEPITLTITIENEEELKSLWGRMGMGYGVINDNNSDKSMNSKFVANEFWAVGAVTATGTNLRW